MPTVPGFGGYGDYYSTYPGEEFIAFIATVMMISFVIGMLINLVLYIFRSIALYKMAERRGMANPGLAWIPMVGIHRAGTIADDINLRNGSRTHFGKILLGGYIFVYVVSYTITISSLITLMTYASEWFMYGGLDYMLEPFYFITSGISWLAAVAVYVLLMISLHKIYKTYRPQSATSWTVLSVIFAFLQPFFLYAIRNAEPFEQWNNPGYYPPGPPPPQQYHQPSQTWQPPQNPQDMPVYTAPEWMPEPPRAPEPPERGPEDNNNYPTM